MLLGCLSLMALILNDEGKSFRRGAVGLGYIKVEQGVEKLSLGASRVIFEGMEREILLMKLIKVLKRTVGKLGQSFESIWNSRAVGIVYEAVIFCSFRLSVSSAN